MGFISRNTPGHDWVKNLFIPFKYSDKLSQDFCILVQLFEIDSSFSKKLLFIRQDNFILFKTAEEPKGKSILVIDLMELLKHIT